MAGSPRALTRPICKRPKHCWRRWPDLRLGVVRDYSILAVYYLCRNMRVFSRVLSAALILRIENSPLITTCLETYARVHMLVNGFYPGFYNGLTQRSRSCLRNRYRYTKTPRWLSMPATRNERPASG